MTTPLSENFVLEEFLRSDYALRAGIQIVPDLEVKENLRRLATQLLQPLRLVYGRMRITSGYRPLWLNTAIGGSKTSMHMYGCAADVEFQDMTDMEVWNDLMKNKARKADWLMNLPFDQIISEFMPEGWIHFGVSRVGAEARGEFLIAKHDPHGKIVYERA